MPSKVSLATATRRLRKIAADKHDADCKATQAQVAALKELSKVCPHKYRIRVKHDPYIIDSDECYICRAPKPKSAR